MHDLDTRMPLMFCRPQRVSPRRIFRILLYSQMLSKVSCPPSMEFRLSMRAFSAEHSLKGRHGTICVAETESSTFSNNAFSAGLSMNLCGNGLSVCGNTVKYKISDFGDKHPLDGLRTDRHRKRKLFRLQLRVSGRRLANPEQDAKEYT